MLLRRTASARGSVVLLCSSVLFASAVRCHGGGITIGPLQYSDVEAKLVSEVPFDLDEKTTIDPLGSPSRVQTLATMSGDPYPINHRLPTPFASVQYPSGGVGVSGIVFQKDATLTAQLLYEESVENIGKVPVQIHYTYRILPLNVSLVAGDGIRGQSAKVWDRSLIRQRFRSLDEQRSGFLFPARR
jgi:hypothetical protein